MAEEENLTQSDKEKLLKAMEDFGGGSFEKIDRDSFEAPELADAFNEMLRRQVERNNKFLVRINDAQSRVGDTSCLKAMLDTIDEQRGAFKALQAARLDITPDERPLSEANQEFLALTAQVKNTFRPCSEDLEEALKLYGQLGVPENTAWSEIEENEEYIVLRQLHKCMLRAAEKLSSMERRINSIDADARGLFEVIDRRTEMSSSFLAGVDSLTASYERLSAKCIDTGRHLYRISRDIDSARNDMFRHNSKPTIHDRLKVYEVDHITVAWRLYNNIVEFENLKLSQVNNPDSCKLGLWISNMTDPLFTEAESFKKVDEMHHRFHERCIETFLAKQDFDSLQALDKFANAMDALEDFLNAMNELHNYLRSKNITEETDLWQFRSY